MYESVSCKHGNLVLISSKEMAYRRRIELLKGLAQLVRWADSLYLRESRPKIDTDPSDIYFDPIAEAVKVDELFPWKCTECLDFAYLELGHQCVKLVSAANIQP